MLGRLLPAALVVVVACTVALAIALDGDGGPSPLARGDGGPARPLTTLGGGPAGSAPLQLRRWRYRADPDDRGRDAGWARGDWDGEAVSVPHAANAGAVSGAAGERAYAGSVGWYAKDVTAPVDGLYSVRFESVHHRTGVYVDGQRVREHVGAYEPFSARVALDRGRHTIVVRADWRDPERQADEGWARAWFNYGGINRPASLARLGPSELGALTVRTSLQGDGARARVQIGVRVRNRDASRTLRVRGALSRDGRVVAPVAFAQAGVPAGTSRALETTVTVDDPRLWSPGRPALYELRLDVPGEASLRRRIGLRELGWGAGGLTLNGEPLELRGVGLPPDARGRGDALIAADERRIVAGLRAAGANATRSQLPLADSMRARLDAAGILVWQEIGPWEPGGRWRFRSPQAVERARDRALRSAEEAQANPSIVAWTLTNEVAGASPLAQQEYMRSTARRLRELDGTRPVAADLWGRRLPSARPGVLAQMDALGVTDYVGWYEALDRAPEAQLALTRERIGRLRELLPGRPIVITELGAAGSARIDGDALGSPRFQARLLGRRLRELRGLPGVSGTIVWNLRDYALRPDFRGGSVRDRRPGLDLAPGLNEKGLYDFEGRPKPALDAVRDAYRER